MAVKKHTKQSSLMGTPRHGVGELTAHFRSNITEAICALKEFCAAVTNGDPHCFTQSGPHWFTQPVNGLPILSCFDERFRLVSIGNARTFDRCAS
jgi:hypothetical protein